MNVLVIGAGAVGSFLGATLAEAGETVCLLRRSGTAGFRQEMLTLGEPSGDVRDVQVGVAGSVDAVPWMPDILLFAVKMPDLPGALETAAHWPAATVLAVENGVGADDLIVDERPAAWLIAGSLTASLETDRGTIRRLSRGGLGLARVRGEGDGLVRELVAAFRSGGLRAAALSDAQEMRWSKLLANLLGNATSALLDVDPEVAYRDPDVFAIERRALREALAVMRALELQPVALPGADVRLLTVASRLPAALVRPIMVRVVARGRGGKSPSLRRHLESGRGPSEVSWLNGAVDRAARLVGRRAPVNLRLSELVEECTRDPERRAWFRGRPDRLAQEFSTPEGDVTRPV